MQDKTWSDELDCGQMKINNRIDKYVLSNELSQYSSGVNLLLTESQWSDPNSNLNRS